MSKKDLETGRQTPPEDHEWHGIWQALDKADKGWLILAPFHAVATNWKALIIVAMLVVYINSDELLGLLRALLFMKPGVGQ